MEAKVRKGFEEQFGFPAEKLFFAPGRVNLIGEHTDYNGGYVFPCALTVGTYMAVSPRSDRQIRLFSGNFREQGVQSFTLDELVYEADHDWANYPKGMMAVMAEAGWKGEKGFDAYVYGNIPNGAGLSSSASIELVMGAAWDDLNDFQIDRIELVKLAQRAENDFIGVQCGIMDQFAIGMGKEAHAMLLDCNTLDYEYAPVELKDMKLVIANTNKRRGLADSKYNERREECDKALALLQQKKDITYLCELSPQEFDEIAEVLTDDTLYRRARHAVTENARTIQAAKALEEGDLQAFGQLMTESHQSLKNDYEVTGTHLDVLQHAAAKQPGVIGSRMTGAGFGGCTVSLVEKQGMDDTLSAIEKAYENEIGWKPDFYVVGIGGGAGLC
ncbi:galactokinase [Alkalicoccus urumqiensis]|uniref:Galactokinase n=1 Tax=Alkalicoccus urumqiensis TaxID=1548213 RepID=A0A2P6MI17_ALKUR|nr:galactokinase [Alkalicoccus urumqiensis]PRO65934.1 galactokinase [Alkalicoccus urumqiensis]